MPVVAVYRRRNLLGTPFLSPVHFQPCRPKQVQNCSRLKANIPLILVRPQHNVPMKLSANLISALTALAIPALLTDASASPTTTLAGTTWSGYDSTGESITYTFEPDGALAHATSKGSWRDGTWKQQGDVVTFEINNSFATYRGQIRGDSIDGTASNKNHFSWTWKVSQRPDSAAQKSTIRPSDRTDGPKNRESSAHRSTPAAGADVVTATPKSERFDIRGLRLGMQRDEAESLMRSLGLQTSDRSNTLTARGEKSVRETSYISSQTFSNGKEEDAKTQMTIEYTPPAPTPRGIASLVWRFEYGTRYGEGLSFDDLAADLEKKYGAPSERGVPNRLQWVAARDCALNFICTPPSTAGERGYFLLAAQDFSLLWRAQAASAKYLDSEDAKRPKDTTRPDF